MQINHGSLYIQHNNTPAFISLSEDLKAKGVILTDIFTAITRTQRTCEKVLYDRRRKSR